MDTLGVTAVVVSEIDALEAYEVSFITIALNGLVS